MFESDGVELVVKLDGFHGVQFGACLHHLWVSSAIPVQNLCSLQAEEEGRRGREWRRVNDEHDIITLTRFSMTALSDCFSLCPILASIQ